MSSTYYTPIHDNHPLPLDVASNFRSATYSHIVLKKEITLYRYYGGDSNKWGCYWSPVPPKGPWEQRIGNAIGLWNTMEHIHKITLPAGSEIFQGFAAPLPGNGIRGSGYTNIPQRESDGVLIGGQMQVYVTVDTLKKYCPESREFYNSSRNGGNGGGGNSGNGGGNGGGKGSNGDGKSNALAATVKLGLPSVKMGNNEFSSVLEQSGLVDSYANSNARSGISKDAVPLYKDPGGVVAPGGKLTSLLVASEGLWGTEHTIALPVNDDEYSWALEMTGNDGFGQIIEAVAAGLQVGASPFFSLHFKTDGAMYPVLHPIFRSSIVGYILGHIDYAMKAFINGAYFPVDFIHEFSEQYSIDPTGALESDNLRRHVIDLGTYCSEHNINYLSLREILAKQGLEHVEGSSSKLFGTDSSDSVTSVKDMHMTNSFRIFAKQRSLKRHGSLFVLDPSFDVEYTIDPSPAEKSELEAYKVKHGEYPDDFKRLEETYKRMADLVRDVMPTLPIFRPLFRLLALVSFAHYHVCTMMEVGRVPRSIYDLNGRDYKPGHGEESFLVGGRRGQCVFPAVLPPIPIKRLKRHLIKLNFKQLFHADANFVQDLNVSIQAMVDAERRGCEGAPVSVALKKELSQQLEIVIRPQLSLIEVPDRILREKVLNDSHTVIVDGEIIECPTLPDYVILCLLRYYRQASDPSQLTQIVDAVLEAVSSRLNALFTSSPDVNVKTYITGFKKELKSIVRSHSNNLTEGLGEIRSCFIGSGQTGRSRDFTSLRDWLTQQEMAIKTRNQKQRDKSIQEIERTMLSQCAEAREKLESDIREASSRFEQHLSEQREEVRRYNLYNTHSVKSLNEFQVSQSRASLKTNATEARIKLENHLRSEMLRIKQDCNRQYDEQMRNLTDAFRSIIESVTSDIDKELANLAGIAVSPTAALLKGASLNFDEQIVCVIPMIGFSSEATISKKDGEVTTVRGGCGLRTSELQELVCEKALHETIEIAVTSCDKSVNCFATTPDRQNYALFRLSVDSDPGPAVVINRPLISSGRVLPDSGHRIGAVELDFLQHVAHGGDISRSRLSKINIAATDVSGQSLLHHVAWYITSKSDLARIVGALPKHLLAQRCARGYLPLHVAASSGNVCALQHLCAGLIDARTAETHETCLFLALAHHDVEKATETVRELLRLGANPNCTLPNGCTPLLAAVRGNREKVSLALLECSAVDINATADGNTTPLMFAALHGLTSVMQVLVSRGATVDAMRRDDAAMAMHLACATGAVDCVQSLLRGLGGHQLASAVNLIAGPTGLTPLHFAVGYHNTPANVESTLKVISMLLESGADINKQEIGTQNTAVHIALLRGHFEIALSLVPYVSLSCVNSEGLTVMDVALKIGAIDVAGEISRRADFHQHDKRNEVNASLLVSFVSYFTSAKGRHMCESISPGGPDGRLLTSRAIDAGLALLTPITSHTRSWSLLQIGVASDCIDAVHLWLSTTDSLRYRQEGIITEGSCPVGPDAFIPLPHLAARYNSCRCLSLLVAFPAVAEVLSQSWTSTKVSSSDQQDAPIGGMLGMVSNIVPSLFGIVSSVVPGFTSSSNATSNAITPRHILSEAIKGGSVEVWDILVRFVPANCTVDEHGSTAIHLAATAGLTSWVVPLVKSGADLLRCRGSDNFTAFHIAISLRNVKMLQTLIDALPQGIAAPIFSNPPLFNLAVSRAFIKGGIKPLVTHLGGRTNKVVICALSGALEVLSSLGDNRAALTAAVQLYELGADAAHSSNMEDTQNTFGAIAKAARAGRTSLLELFLVAVHPENVVPALQIAIAAAFETWSVESLEVLLKHPRNVDILDQKKCLLIAEYNQYRQHVADVLNQEFSTSNLAKLRLLFSKFPSLNGVRIQRPSNAAAFLPEKLPVLHAIIVSGRRGYLSALPSYGMNSCDDWPCEVDSNGMGALTHLSIVEMASDDMLVIRQWVKEVREVCGDVVFRRLLSEQDERDYDMLIGADPKLSNLEALAKAGKKLLAVLTEFKEDLRFYDGNTRTHMMVANDCKSLVTTDEKGSMLIKKDLTTCNNAGETPLHMFIKTNSSLATLEWLIANGSDLTAITADGNTPLQLAIQRKVPIEISLRLAAETTCKAHRNHLGETAWLIAASVGNITMVRLLAPENKREVDSLLTCEGMNALALAAARGEVGVISVLVRELGSSVSFVNPPTATRPGWSAAHFAATYGQPSALHLLQELGADLSLPGNDGSTPIGLALSSHCGFSGPMFDLIRSSISASRLVRSNPSAMLTSAAIGGNGAIIWWLDSMGVDFALPLSQANGGTIVHLAALLSKLNVVKAVVQASCAVPELIKARDNDGKTALHQAHTDQDVAIAMLLCQYGFDIDALDSDGNTPMHFCAQKLQLTAWLNLYRCGADLTVRNRKGETPALAAMSRALSAGGGPAEIQIATIIAICSADIDKETLNCKDVYQLRQAQEAFMPLLEEFASFGHSDSVAHSLLNKHFKSTNDIIWKQASDAWIHRNNTSLIDSAKNVSPPSTTCDIEMAALAIARLEPYNCGTRFRPLDAREVPWNRRDRALACLGNIHESLQCFLPLDDTNGKWTRAMLEGDLVHTVAFHEWPHDIDAMPSNTLQDATSVLEALNAMSTKRQNSIDKGSAIGSTLDFVIVEQAKVCFMAAVMRQLDSKERDNFIRMWAVTIPMWCHPVIVSSVLAVYPWDIVASPVFFQLAIAMQSYHRGAAIWSWFQAYFNCSLLHPQVNALQFGQAVYTFRRFMDELELIDSKGCDALPKAPKTSISFTSYCQSQTISYPRELSTLLFFTSSAFTLQDTSSVLDTVIQKLSQYTSSGQHQQDDSMWIGWIESDSELCKSFRKEIDALMSLPSKKAQFEIESNTCKRSEYLYRYEKTTVTINGVDVFPRKVESRDECAVCRSPLKWILRPLRRCAFCEVAVCKPCAPKVTLQTIHFRIANRRVCSSCRMRAAAFESFCNLYNSVKILITSETLLDQTEWALQSWSEHELLLQPGDILGSCAMEVIQLMGACQTLHTVMQGRCSNTTTMSILIDTIGCGVPADSVFAQTCIRWMWDRMNARRMADCAELAVKTRNPATMTIILAEIETEHGSKWRNYFSGISPENVTEYFVAEENFCRLLLRCSKGDIVDVLRSAVNAGDTFQAAVVVAKSCDLFSRLCENTDTKNYAEILVEILPPFRDFAIRKQHESIIRHSLKTVQDQVKRHQTSEILRLIPQSTWDSALLLCGKPSVELVHLLDLVILSCSDYLGRCVLVLQEAQNNAPDSTLAVCQIEMLANLAFPMPHCENEKLNVGCPHGVALFPSGSTTYSNFRKQTLRSFASTVHITTIMSFFEAVDDAMGSLAVVTPEEKRLVSLRAIEAMQQRDFDSHSPRVIVGAMRTWAALAARVVEELGDRVLSFLCEQNFSTYDLETLLKIGQLLISLGSKEACSFIKQRQKSSGLNMKMEGGVLFKELQREVSRLEAGKYCELPLSQKLNEFANAVSFPLSQNHVKLIGIQYELVLAEAPMLVGLSRSELATVAVTAGKMLHRYRLDGRINKIDSPSSCDMTKINSIEECDREVFTQRARLLASLRELVRQVYGIFPYSTQILALLGIIGIDRGTTHDRFYRGCIAQVRTGEGKSITVAMLAASLALCGHAVDVVTSTAYLATRDAEEYGSFFSQLGISSSVICASDENPSPHQFDACVLYGINTDFEFALLRDGLFGGVQNAGATASRLCMTRSDRFLPPAHIGSDGQVSNSLGSIPEYIPRPRDCIIVDEADCMLLDAAGCAARMSVRAIEDFSWVYEPLFSLRNSVLGPLVTPAIAREVLAAVDGGRWASDAAQISDLQLSTWLACAEHATTLLENHHYIVEKDRHGRKVGPVRIVDAENTGRVSGNSEWSNGLHQFVEVKEGLKIGCQNATAGDISHAAFFTQYGMVVGVTGTMGGSYEREEVLAVYDLDAFDVPVHRECKREVLKPVTVDGEQLHIVTVVDEVKAMRLSKRPVLVICDTISSATRFSQALNAGDVPHRVLDDRQSEDEGFIVMCAGQAGAVTVATNTAGRGTDIKPTQAALDAGGLHVIVTFLPANTRVEEQAIGRAGRQGQPGSSRIIMEISRSMKELGVPLDLESITLQHDDSVAFNLCLSARDHRVQILSLQRRNQAAVQKQHYLIQEHFFWLRGLLASWCDGVSATALVSTARTTSNSFDGDNGDNGIYPASSRILEIARRLPPGVTLAGIVQMLPRVLVEEWGRFYTPIANHQDVFVNDGDDPFWIFVVEVFGNHLKEDLLACLAGHSSQFELYPLSLVNFVSQLFRISKNDDKASLIR